MKYAMVMETKSWMGKHLHLFTGSSALELLGEFEKIQDLDCLCRMGAVLERGKNKKGVGDLYVLCARRDSGELEIDDLRDMYIFLSAGSFRCLDIFEGEDAQEKARQKYNL